MTIPPPPSRTKRKGPPPTEADVPGALFGGAADAAAPAPAPVARKRDTPFNFRIEKDMERRFSRRAFDLEVDKVDLLEAMVDLFLDDDRLADEVRARVERAKRKA